jgi:hypothetical protein
MTLQFSCMAARIRQAGRRNYRKCLLNGGVERESRPSRIVVEKKNALAHGQLSPDALFG